MTEPDVTLTDYGLALECAALAWLLWRRESGANGLRVPWVIFFASISVTSFLGGTFHGYFLDPSSLGDAVLWPATLLGVGVTALSAWIIGARLQFSPGAARRIELAALAGFLAYAATVLFVSTSFRVAVVNYLPAALFLLAVYAIRARRQAGPSTLWGLCGLALTLAAAALQQAGIGLHPSYFNHNALYHLLQAVGLFLIFLSARILINLEAAGGDARERM
ncbi:MAG: hypothetical protein Q8R92_10765 [Deltaproteobacteria bacterium]|nr:hypothetical protein [Deltaproteobacteria bacterium]